MILLQFATGEWVSRIVICRITDLFITTCCRWHEFILAYKTNLHRFVRRRTGSLKVVKWFGKSRCVQSGCRYYQKQGIKWLRWKQRFVIMRPSVTYHTTTWLRNTSPTFQYALAILTLPERIPRLTGCLDPFRHFTLLRNTIPHSRLLIIPWYHFGQHHMFYHSSFLPICLYDILPYALHYHLSGLVPSETQF